MTYELVLKPSSTGHRLEYIKQFIIQIIKHIQLKTYGYHHLRRNFVGVIQWKLDEIIFSG